MLRKIKSKDVFMSRLMLRHCWDRRQSSSLVASSITNMVRSARMTSKSLLYLRKSTKASAPQLAGNSYRRRVWKEISSRPVEFLSVPCVAAFVGILTNWIGVKMLFYPIDYHGLNLKRWEMTPYGLFGWQGVVPTKTDLMAKRLVSIVSRAGRMAHPKDSL